MHFFTYLGILTTIIVGLILLYQIGKAVFSSDEWVVDSDRSTTKLVTDLCGGEWPFHELEVVKVRKKVARKDREPITKTEYELRMNVSSNETVKVIRKSGAWYSRGETLAEFTEN